MKINILIVPIACVAFALLGSQTLAAAQTSSGDTVPIPAQLMSAKKIFVANGGEDPVFGYKPDRGYSQLYTKLKEGAHYDLVTSPADADLVFQIQIVATRWQPHDIGTIPMLRLSILDPKSQVVLWVFNERVDAGRNLDTRFNNAMDRVLGDLKTLSGSHP